MLYTYVICLSESQIQGYSGFCIFSWTVFKNFSSYHVAVMLHNVEGYPWKTIVSIFLHTAKFYDFYKICNDLYKFHVIPKVSMSIGTLYIKYMTNFINIRVPTYFHVQNFRTFPWLFQNTISKTTHNIQHKQNCIPYFIPNVNYCKKINCEILWLCQVFHDLGTL